MRFAFVVLLVSCSHPAPPPPPAPKPVDAPPREPVRIEKPHPLVQQHRAEIWTCYAAGLTYNSEMAGRVIVRVEGGVPRVVKSTIGSEPVEQCLLDAVKGWRVVENVEFPIVLSRTETW